MSGVAVWVVDLALPASRLTECAGVLDADERARAERFVRPEDRARYVASHAALRLVLGVALSRAPAALRFVRGPAGKPGLADAALAFNLSHSGARALIGLADAPVGVDVEVHRPLPDAIRIARTHFAPDEVAALAASPPGTAEAAFFGLWTRKEAVVKALGAGLSLPLDRFSVSVPPAPPRLVRIPDAGSWTLADVDAGPGSAATVAVRSPDATISVERLPADWPDSLRG